MNRDFKGVWIPKEIYLNKDLNWTEKILLTEIDSLDNEHGCFASNDYFAEFLGVHKMNISKAISNLKKLGYIYQESFDGRTRILRSNLGNITSETESAETDLSKTLTQSKQPETDLSKTLTQSKRKDLLSINENAYYNNTSNNIYNNIKEKEINKEKEISVSDSDNSFSKKASPAKKVFKKPTADEVRSYCIEAHINIDADRFIDFYESKGWKVGSAPMKDWKAAVRNWSRRENNTPAMASSSANKSITPGSFSSFTLEDLESKVNRRYEAKAQEMMDQYERELGIKT